MSDYPRIPDGFSALCYTHSPVADASYIARHVEQTGHLGLNDLDTDRIVYANHIEKLDAALVARFVNGAERAQRQGRELLICDPPPIFRSYLEVYGHKGLLDGRVLVADENGRYTSDLVEFVPPFVPDSVGRIDVYEDGTHRSYRYGQRHLEEIEPVDLTRYVRKVTPAVSSMAVTGAAGEREAMEAKAYVHLRRYNCSCSVTHSTFDKLHTLQKWARAKGFDFVDMELMAGEQPSETITYRTEYRDRQHYDQYQTLLKIDTSWQKIVEGVGAFEDEFHYTY